MATVHRMPASAFPNGSGAFSFKVTVAPESFKELNQIAKGLANTTNIMNSPHTMAVGIPVIGQDWLYNWANRGNKVGGWAPLSEFTVQEKQLRGYSGKRILEQSGGFYRGALAGFAQWTPNKVGYSADIPATPAQSGGDYHFDSGHTRVAAQIGMRRFSAVIDGAKAAHQEGGVIKLGDKYDKSYSVLPARPFWYFDQSMIDRSANLMMNDFLSRWVEKMPNPVGAANRTPFGVFNVNTGVVNTTGRQF